MDARGYRFRTGAGPSVDATGLLDVIRTDEPVILVEPDARPLAWSPEIARRWACDCVEHALPAAGDEDVAPLKFALETARQFADSEIPAGILDSVFTELFVTDWPTYEGSYFKLVEATRQAAARDAAVASPYGSGGTVRPGEWAATAAKDARAAVDDPAAELRWQAERLLDHLLGAAVTSR